MCYLGTCYCNADHRGADCGTLVMTLVQPDYYANVTFSFYYKKTLTSFWSDAMVSSFNANLKAYLAARVPASAGGPNVTSTTVAEGGPGSVLTSVTAYYMPAFTDAKFVDARNLAGWAYAFNPAESLGAFFDLSPPPPAPSPPSPPSPPYSSLGYLNGTLPPVVNITFMFIYAQTPLPFWNASMLTAFSANLAANLTVAGVGAPNVTSAAAAWSDGVYTNGSVVNATAFFNITLFSRAQVREARPRTRPSSSNAPPDRLTRTVG